MQEFRKLRVWQRAPALTLEVYRVTRRFPDDERVGLVSQLRRASVSIATNIAEGCGRDRPGELVHFLSIASGSSSEVDYQLQLARDLKLIDEEEHCRLDAEVIAVRRMLLALRRGARTP